MGATKIFTSAVSKVMGIRDAFIPRPDRIFREQAIFAALNSEDGVGIPPTLRSRVPRAEVWERGLSSFQEIDWREYFSLKLSGRGLEIGPLHRPMVRHDEMEVQYLDRFSVAELREHYPELADLPLVEADIIGDAQTLSTVGDQQYDFLISAHVIEHMRNPILALEHWCRVLRPGGLLYLVVPDKRKTFDKLGVRTLIEHMILDYLEPSEERDLEHYLDFVVRMNKYSGLAALEEAERLGQLDYSIHYHVFLPSDVVSLIRWFSRNVRPIEILEGPCMATVPEEFHLLLRVADY